MMTAGGRQASLPCTVLNWCHSERACQDYRQQRAWGVYANEVVHTASRFNPMVLSAFALGTEEGLRWLGAVFISYPPGTAGSHQAYSATDRLFKFFSTLWLLFLSSIVCLFFLRWCWLLDGLPFSYHHLQCTVLSTSIFTVCKVIKTTYCWHYLGWQTIYNHATTSLLFQRFCLNVSLSSHARNRKSERKRVGLIMLFENCVARIAAIRACLYVGG